MRLRPVGHETLARRLRGRRRDDPSVLLVLPAKRSTSAPRSRSQLPHCTRPRHSIRSASARKARPRGLASSAIVADEHELGTGARGAVRDRASQPCRSRRRRAPRSSRSPRSSPYESRAMLVASMAASLQPLGGGLPRTARNRRRRRWPATQSSANVLRVRGTRITWTPRPPWVSATTSSRCSAVVDRQAGQRSSERVLVGATPPVAAALRVLERGVLDLQQLRAVGGTRRPAAELDDAIARNASARNPKMLATVAPSRACSAKRDLHTSRRVNVRAVPREPVPACQPLGHGGSARGQGSEQRVEEPDSARSDRGRARPPVRATPPSASTGTP